MASPSPFPRSTIAPDEDYESQPSLAAILNVDQPQPEFSHPWQLIFEAFYSIVDSPNSQLAGTLIMSKPTDSPVKSPTGAESPTTVRPLEMDDDDVQDTGGLGSDAPANSKHATVEDEPPTKPPRPLSPQQQAENTLKEAFPSIDAAVVKAVLTASGGRVEPAFNALLGMSDPDAVREPSPPPQPPRPVAHRVGSTPQSQLESDEQYARQLAEHYGGGYQAGPRTSSREYSGQRSERQQQTRRPNDDPYDENHSFLDDDLPMIKENLRKGFLETQTTVNGWIKTLKKRIDGEDEEDEDDHQRSSNRPSNQQYRGRRSNDGRQSGDYGRYDADPQVLSDDFAGMQINSDGSAAPRRSTRPLANPDLFKPTPSPPVSSEGGRRVAFQNGPPEDMDLYRSSPNMGAKDNTPAVGKQSKWQPLSTVDPNPIGDNDNDPFSLGDSEDEKESKQRVGGKEGKQDETERLKRAAAEAMSDDIGKPEPAEVVCSKAADEKLAGKS